MPKTVDYYHFLISPWSYLAVGRFATPERAARRASTPSRSTS